MDTILEKILTTGGPLGVLVIVVWIFVKAWATHSKDQREWFTGLHKEHLDAREQSRAAVIENTTATKELTRTIDSWAKK